VIDDGHFSHFLVWQKAGQKRFNVVSEERLFVWKIAKFIVPDVHECSIVPDEKTMFGAITIYGH
jgi:hypothetical protein